MTNSLSAYQIKAIPIPKIHFTLDDTGRARLLTKAKHLYDKFLRESNRDGVLEFVSYHLSEGQTEVVHDLLAFLAKQVIDCNKERRALMEKFDLFYFIDRNTSCLKIEQALPALFNSNETLTHLEDIYHDIEGLRLTSGGKGQWLLEIYAKLRDPEQHWREYQRDEEDNLVRQWLPVFRLALGEEVGQFYHYAFANLDGFTGAGKFPGGYTRTTYEKLMTIEVPRYVPIDLTPLVEAEAELAETHRKIELTDKLIDQIVYKLYGLTDDEIAIVEGRV